MSHTMPTLLPNPAIDLVPDRERRAKNPNTVAIVGSLTEPVQRGELYGAMCTVMAMAISYNWL